jgi:UDP-N-acetylglucosamine transferase subunit ALG13
MGQAFREKKQGKTRVLVAPLDWGLGHATRCIPIVRGLINAGCEVWIAAEGRQSSLLKQEFPQLNFLELEGYRIRYSRSGAMLPLKIFLQLPRLWSVVFKERRWLRKMISKYEFDIVISDNRYGLYNPRTISVFITHQLAIRSTFKNFGEGILRKLHYRFIRHFNICWVPDMDGKRNLAGKLSHPETLPSVPVRYIGILSRFFPRAEQEIPNHLLIILSGPEPQRTIFEDQLIDQVSRYPGTAVVARGLPEALSLIPSTGMLKFYNHLPAEQLNEEMAKAEFVIARSGYSTVMDIVMMKKKSILVPTPGQTEQLYLAEHLAAEKIVFTLSQKNFSLNKALEEARQYHFKYFDVGNDLRNAIGELFEKLKAN